MVAITKNNENCCQGATILIPGMADKQDGLQHDSWLKMTIKGSHHLN